MRNRNEIEAQKKSDFEQPRKEKDTCEVLMRAVGDAGLAVNLKR